MTRITTPLTPTTIQYSQWIEATLINYKKNLQWKRRLLLAIIIILQQTGDRAVMRN